VIFAPFVATLTAISFVWSDLFDLNYGFFNYLLSLIGHAPVAWLSYPETARFAIAIMLIWHNIGFNMLVFIAGLQGIDNTYYEAAIVDGARPIRIFFRITLPLLSPITFFLLINMIIRGFQIYESVYVLTAGGPGYSTSTLVYFIYRTAFLNFNVGLASAMSMVLFILIGICTIVMWTLQKRWVHYGD
jgi:multiple sugar transport system permease protein